MFRRLLIANRGEVAVRVARAARELGITPLGVASEADLEASWTGVMDEVLCIGPSAATQSYLRADRLVQAALQLRASALHPGWGFLAEDPALARLCRQHGVAFVGPRPSVIELMGKKTPARRAMQRAGLEVVPGSDRALADVDEAAGRAAELGYPVLLKAVSGGGGRGMRRASDEQELREAFAAAASEAEAAFGSGAIYLERCLSGARHIEIQVLCDSFGRGVHLSERECSVQRKHQKLIEECPSPALTAAERARLGERAIRAALSVGYTNAGTLEFLREADGSFWFLEMNTRLQVEHPVTELTHGVDVPRLQLEIAANCRLDALGLVQSELVPRGHAIECRINAEDPARDFRPSPGRLFAFDFPTDLGPGTVRVDTHLSAGDTVSPHYDSLVAKVIAHADTRERAIETMRNALSSARVEGVATTVPLHLAVLADERFRAGDYDTSSIPGWPRPAA